MNIDYLALGCRLKRVKPLPSFKFKSSMRVGLVNQVLDSLGRRLAFGTYVKKWFRRISTDGDPQYDFCGAARARYAVSNNHLPPLEYRGDDRPCNRIESKQCR